MALTGTYATPDEVIAGNPVPATTFNKYGNDIIYLYNNIPATLLTTRGDLLVRGAAAAARLAIGASGRYLRSDGTDPSWSPLLFADLTYSGLTTGQIPRATGATTVAFGALDLANASAVTGTLPAGNLPTATNSTKGIAQAGNDIGVSSGVFNLNKGTAFPTSPTPANNDLFYRTDLGKWFRYVTGSPNRWLSDRYALPFAAYTNLQPTNVSGNVPFLAPLPNNDILLHYFRCQMVYVGSITSGGFWTITLRTEGSGGVSTLASFTTSGYTAATYTQGTLITSFATNPVVAGAKTISIEVTKSGTTTDLYITPYLSVSDIAT